MCVKRHVTESKPVARKPVPVTVTSTPPPVEEKEGCTEMTRGSRYKKKASSSAADVKAAWPCKDIAIVSCSADDARGGQLAGSGLGRAHWIAEALAGDAEVAAPTPDRETEMSEPGTCTGWPVACWILHTTPPGDAPERCGPVIVMIVPPVTGPLDGVTAFAP